MVRVVLLCFYMGNVNLINMNYVVVVPVKIREIILLPSDLYVEYAWKILVQQYSTYSSPAESNLIDITHIWSR